MKYEFEEELKEILDQHKKGDFHNIITIFGVEYIPATLKEHYERNIRIMEQEQKERDFPTPYDQAKKDREKRYDDLKDFKSIITDAPKPTVQKCKLIYSDSLIEFEKEINEYLKDGWKMLDGIVNVEYRYMQKMVKDFEE